MKQRINANQRGFLLRENDFVRLLTPGQYTVWPFLKDEVNVVTPLGSISADKADLNTYLRDETFAAETVGLEVGDGQLAIWLIDGRIRGYLETGYYRFWNIFEKNTFRVFDVTNLETGDVPREYFDHIPLKYYVRAEIAAGETGLLFVDGAYDRTLQSGTHLFWNVRRKVTVRKVDMRVRQMDVSSQEILTADKVGVRLNFLCSYRVTDPVGLETKLAGAVDQLYSAVQLALREYVGHFRLDALLEQKDTLAQTVLDTLREGQDALYVEFVGAGLKDIILPGEIRDIMNTVLVAEKKAQANVIARREEVSSTRSLLNTAKLLDENATLARLKELESLERIFDKVGTISVGGGEGLLAQLRQIAGVSE